MFRHVLATLLVVGVVGSGANAAEPPERDQKKPAKSEGSPEMTYTAPGGWEKSEQERIIVFTPPGVSPRQVALIITPGENLDGDFLKWFKTKWEALRKDAQVIQGGERTGQEGPNGSSVLYQAALLEGTGAGGAKKDTGLLLYAVHVGDAVHWVVFRTDGADRFNRYKKTVNQFLAGLKFVEVVEQDAPRTRQGAAKEPPGDKSKPKLRRRPSLDE